MFQHTGEKPHVCPLCQKGLTRKHSLRKHLSKVHGFECSDIELNKLIVQNNARHGLNVPENVHNNGAHIGHQNIIFSQPSHFGGL